MACFLVPAAEAIVVTTAWAVMKAQEKKAATVSIGAPKADFSSSEKKISMTKKLSWLMSILWGGVALLAFEHFWHGEIQPFMPFLTAMASPEETSEMLREMATVGVGMAVAATAVWAAVCAFAELKLRQLKASLAKENN